MRRVHLAVFAQLVCASFQRWVVEAASGNVGFKANSHVGEDGFHRHGKAHTDMFDSFLLFDVTNHP